MKLKFIFFLISILFMSCESATTTIKTETFKVWGNCEKCKRTIEKSSKVEGVIESNWNKDSKLMVVKFDTTLINLDFIQQAIAKVGYDNDGYYGDDYAYNKLDSCCMYERRPFELQ